MQYTILSSLLKSFMILRVKLEYCRCKRFSNPVTTDPKGEALSLDRATRRPLSVFYKIYGFLKKITYEKNNS
jgi:hypothetical protein